MSRRLVVVAASLLLFACSADVDESTAPSESEDALAAGFSAGSYAEVTCGFAYLEECASPASAKCKNVAGLGKGRAVQILKAAPVNGYEHVVELENEKKGYVRSRCLKKTTAPTTTVHDAGTDADAATTTTTAPTGDDAGAPPTSAAPAFPGDGGTETSLEQSKSGDGDDGDDGDPPATKLPKRPPATSGCSMTSGATPSSFGLVLLGLFAVARRRRRS